MQIFFVLFFPFYVCVCVCVCVCQGHRFWRRLAPFPEYLHRFQRCIFISDLANSWKEEKEEVGGRRVEGGGRVAERNGQRNEARSELKHFQMGRSQERGRGRSLRVAGISSQSQEHSSAPSTIRIEGDKITKKEIEAPGNR